MSSSHGSYYLPSPSHWPIIGSIGLFLTLVGAANWIHGATFGPYLFGVGVLIVICMMVGWFRTVIHESLGGLYDDQVGRSFRLGMVWFIFTEVCFFGVLFGALFYARLVIIPTLGGSYDSTSALTNLVLWPNFEAAWPLLAPPSADFPSINSVMETWGIPAFNTLVLLSSGATITWAHWALIKNKQLQLLIAMLCTVSLGILFLVMQSHEYYTAYAEKALTLHSGIYGTIFFMLTGFHGLHVTLGTIMLIVIFFRCWRGHFNKSNQFAFEAVSWYWHFVDVVWLGLFIFVYWI